MEKKKSKGPGDPFRVPRTFLFIQAEEKAWIKKKIFSTKNYKKIEKKTGFENFFESLSQTLQALEKLGDITAKIGIFWIKKALKTACRFGRIRP